MFKLGCPLWHWVNTKGFKIYSHRLVNNEVSSHFLSEGPPGRSYNNTASSIQIKDIFFLLPPHFISWALYRQGICLFIDVLTTLQYPLFWLLMKWPWLRSAGHSADLSGHLWLLGTFSALPKHIGSESCSRYLFRADLSPLWGICGVYLQTQKLIFG